MLSSSANASNWNSPRQSSSLVSVTSSKSSFKTTCTENNVHNLPSTIGAYGMGRLLGRGAFGSVYEVSSIKRQPLGDTKYAIKIIEKKSIKNEEMARRVRNEVALHRRLRHPNVLALYHFFEDDERVYLVMELCARGELYNLLRRRREEGEGKSIGGETGIAPAGTLNEHEARAILRDIVAGLRFLHSRGIIHRDLKLSNVLLSESGQAKIADFGLAVRATADGERNDGGVALPDVAERTICGTPNYLAPEILKRHGYGRSADIWSLGCLLYSFLVGRPPFDSPDLPSTFDRVKRHDYLIPEYVSASARDLIRRLLTADPELRPSFDQIIWHPFFNPAVSLPLSTRRLSPLNQTTKYGSIELNRDGRVVVDFLDAQELISISRDGLRLEVHPKRQQSASSEMSQPAIWSVAQIPEEHKKRYEYARRFINLIKAKTPLLVLSTPQIKAYLMENSCVPGAMEGTGGLIQSPMGDFHLHYRDGTLRLDYCWISRQLRISDASNGLVLALIHDPSYLAVEELPEVRLRAALLEFLARYRQCLQIRTSILHPDGSERGTLAGSFPYLVREGFGDANTNASTSFMKENRNPNLYGFQQNYNQSFNQLSQISQVNQASQPAQPTHNPQCNFPALHRKFLAEVGWCLSDTPFNDENNDDGQFLVLFIDGSVILVDSAANSLVDLTQSDSIAKWSISAQLPEHLKQKLALFSRFL